MMYHDDHVDFLDLSAWGARGAHIFSCIATVYELYVRRANVRKKIIIAEQKYLKNIPVILLLFIYSSYFHNISDKYKVTYSVYKSCAKSHYSTTTTKG